MHVVFFTSDDQTFAIPTRFIVEVIPVVHWRPLAGSERWMKGLFNYRATLLPLLDFDLLLGRDERGLRRTARILVVRSVESQVAEMHTAKLGLLVQRVLGSEQLDVDRRATLQEEIMAGRAIDSPQESGQTPSTGDSLSNSSSGPAASTIDPVGAMRLQSLLGPVVLTPTGMVQLIRVDGIPTPELS